MRRGFEDVNCAFHTWGSCTAPDGKYYGIWQQGDFLKVVLFVKSPPVTGSLDKDRCWIHRMCATQPSNLLNNKILFLFLFFLQKFRYSNKFLYIAWTLKKLHTTFGRNTTEQNEKGSHFFFFLKKIKTYFLYLTFSDLHVYYLCTNGTLSMIQLQSTKLHLGFMEKTS